VGYRSDMFVKITTSGPRQYVKLVESYRDTPGMPQQRVIATLGCIEAVRSGAAGKPSLEEGTGEVAFAPALLVGDTWLRTALWKEPSSANAFRRLLRNRQQFDAERLLRLMVFNRLCAPESRLGILRWLEGTRVPEVSAEAVTQPAPATHHGYAGRGRRPGGGRSGRSLAAVDRSGVGDRLLRSDDDPCRRSSDDSEELRHFGHANGHRDSTPPQTMKAMTVPSPPTPLPRAGEGRFVSRRRDFHIKEGGSVLPVVLGVLQTAQDLPTHHELQAARGARR
jgi:hypothetical protein